MRSKRGLLMLILVALSVKGLYAEEVQAAVTKADIDAITANLNIVWTLVAAVLVFWMQAGFAMVETGFTRAKNSVNILMKNLMDFSIGSIAFYTIGFGLMFGTSKAGFIGTDMFFMNGIVGTEGGSEWGWTFMIFQTVFAATAATIVSGAMAERTKFRAYLLYCVAICLFVYPVFGKWAWGSLFNSSGTGWLQNLSTGAFTDFAGSTVVHSVGGWLALAGAIIVGPRIGKYAADGTAKAIPGHNITIAGLGVFILWMGWFGFNAGSTTIGNGEIGRVAMTTNLSAVAGTISAMFTAWFLFKKPDASMALNGALAGLVGVTAGCYTVTPAGALAIGAVSGVLVVGSVLFIDKKLKIDDPVGAISVHGVCGLWGTLACGLFNGEKVIGMADASTGLFYGGGFNQLISQFIGAGAAFLWAFGMGLVLFKAIDMAMGLRVTREEELRGLDIDEHGMEAYHGFQIFTNQ